MTDVTGMTPRCKRKPTLAVPDDRIAPHILERLAWTSPGPLATATPTTSTTRPPSVRH